MSLVTLVGIRHDRVAQRNDGFGDLLGRTTAAEQAISYAEGRVLAMVQYTSPMLTSASAPVRVRADMERLVREAAAAGAATVRQARSDVVARRDGGFPEARDAYLRYLDDWIGYLRSASENFDELYRQHPRLQQDRATARLAFAHDAPSAGAAARARAVLTGS